MIDVPVGIPTDYAVLLTTTTQMDFVCVWSCYIGQAQRDRIGDSHQFIQGYQMNAQIPMLDRPCGQHSVECVSLTPMP